MSDLRIDPEDLADALREQVRILARETVDTVNAIGLAAIEKLVSLTKSTVPKRTGNYGKAITYTEETDPITGDKTFTWGAKAPFYRLTHLLVNGHADRGGGRVKGDPFLQNALDTVLPEYEQNVEEALPND